MVDRRGWLMASHSRFRVAGVFVGVPGKKPRWTDEALTAAVRGCRSIAQVLRALGLRPVGGNYSTMGRAIARLGLDTSHFRGKGWRQGSSTPVVPPRPLDVVLVRESPQIHRGTLKRRLVRAGLL